jgi:hypothetical protein
MRMPQGATNKYLIGVLIVLLHLPLIYYALTLYADLAPGRGVSDLGPGSGLILLLLLVLPYGVLAGLGIRWNPERARLNEIID